jgi:hypothetical protein
MEIVNYIFVKHNIGHGEAMGTPSRTFFILRKEFFHNEINMGKKIK